MWIAMRWSDNITVAELTDEPILSEDLGSLIVALEIDPDTGSHLVLNMQAVSYINSSNIGQLLRLRKLLLSSGKTLVLCAVTDEVLDVIRVTGIKRLFRFAPDPLVALALIQIEEEAGA